MVEGWTREREREMGWLKGGGWVFIFDCLDFGVGKGIGCGWDVWLWSIVLEVIFLVGK